MIIESSKDYGTGTILMIGDGNTSEDEAVEYVKKNYGVDARYGLMDHEPESEYGGFVNPETWTFTPIP